MPFCFRDSSGAGIRQRRECMQTYAAELVTPVSVRSAHQLATEPRQGVSSFIAKKLDIYTSKAHSQNMGPAAKSPARSQPAMRLVRHRIERGGERLWRFEDFRDLRFSAVAQALSRL